VNAGDVIDPKLPRSRISQFPKRLRKAALFEQLGPGLVTGAADDDPSGIATYSQAGAQFGFDMLWTMILTYPLMTAVQLVSAQIGRVTGCGLAKNMGDVFPKPLVLVVIGLLFIANTINIGANLAAMGSAAELVIGWGGHIFTVAFALVSLTLQLFISYERYDPRSPRVRRRRVRSKSRLERGGCGVGHTQDRSHLRQLDHGRRYLRHDDQPVPDVLAK
jgi:hypothetical protein